METLEGAFARLQAAYETYDHNNGVGICALNFQLREQLKQYAASERLSINVGNRLVEKAPSFFPPHSLALQQDSAGNIGITKPGRDSTLAAIALSFPLDGCGKSWFMSAFRVFNLLRADDLQCDVTLLGAKKRSAPPMLSQLERFSNLADPSTITFSAIVEVWEDAAVVTEVTGTPILVVTAKEHMGARGQLKTTVLERRAIRAPELRVVGMEAEVVTRELVKHYSEYVAALFENFD
ncbi:hypothetical protein EV127DRAFT_410852 [Xylaria flabelliformis]|nr:hypothetical protein EV127DRAFT_410852 [Xylaria flabelliformis]